MHRVTAWARAHRLLAALSGVLLVFLIVGAVNAATTGGKGASSGPAAAGAPSTAAASPAAPSPSPVASTPAPSPTPASSTPAPPSTAAAAPSPSCTLPDDRDLIVRYTVPGLQTQAQELGEADLANCTTTLDMLEQTSPTGPGYCTQAAWADQNPGYNPDATPAAPLKHVLEAVGAGC